MAAEPCVRRRPVAGAIVRRTWQPPWRSRDAPRAPHRGGRRVAALSADRAPSLRVEIAQRWWLRSPRPAACFRASSVATPRASIDVAGYPYRDRCAGPRPTGASEAQRTVGGGHSSFAARVAAAGLQGVARRERRTRHHVSLSPPAGHVHRSLHRCMDSPDRRTPGRREPGGWTSLHEERCRTSLDRAKRAPCDTHSGWGTSAGSRGAGLRHGRRPRAINRP